MAGENRKKVTINFLILLLIIFVIFASCQSAPKVTDAALIETTVPFYSGASVYILADLKQARTIIDLLPIEELNNRQTMQMLDRTDFLAAAMFPQESGRRFQIAALGNYPSSQANFAFTFNRDWQKKRSQTGGSFWYSRSNRLSIAINSRQAFAASSLNDEPCDPLISGAGVEIPEGFNEFRTGAPLSCWFEDPAPLINRILSSAGIPLQFPIQSLFISLLTAAQDEYEAIIRLQFENPSHARGVAAILNMASMLSAGDSGSIIGSIFFANPPVQNGNYVNIKTAILNEEEIVQLLGIFLFV